MQRPVTIRATARQRACGAAMLAAGLALAPASAEAQTVEQKAQLCSACHGDNGIPQQKTTPAIWAQQLGYFYVELRDFKSGARKNDQMSAVVASLERDDMLALGNIFRRSRGPTWDSRRH